MKILVIRGQNLASLAGGFELNLVEGELAQAGLFAITGPVGAGKSTVLDAMCLALFDRTPRLSARGGAMVGRAEDDQRVRVGANDVRGLLRRGTGTGFAEVEFVGVDGRQYRSRWTVKRARGRANGALQRQEMEFWDVGAEAGGGGKKTEILDQIQAKLGLSFEQFRRSALLAQGEFSSFLKAEQKDRAFLLERMTGTELYGRLSEAAYKRGSAEKSRVDELQRDVDRVSLLSDEAREQLVLERTGLQQRLDTWKQRDASWQLQDVWQQQLTKLKEGVVQSTQALEVARTELKGLDGRRTKLAEIQKAQVLRPEFKEAQRAAEERSKAEGLSSDAVAAHKKCLSDLRVAKNQFDSSVSELERAESTQHDKQPEIEKAKQIDEQIAVQVSTAGAHRETVREVGLDLEAAEGDAKANELAQAEQAKLLGRDQAWLLEHVLAGRLAPRWDSWRRQLDELGVNHKSLEQIADRLAQAERQNLDAARGVSEWDATVGETRKNLDDAEDELRKLEASRPAGELASLASHREKDEVRKALIIDLQTLVGRRQEEGSRQAEADEAFVVAKAEITAAPAREKILQTAASEVVTRLSEARRSLDKAVLTADLADHRQSLVAGEPCPLCGALEHPLACDSVAQSILEELRVRVESLTKEQSDTKRDLAVHEQGVKSLEARAVEHRENLKARELGVAQFDREIHTLRDDVTGAPADHAVLVPWLACEIERLEASLSSLRSQESSLFAYQSKREALRHCCDDLRSKWQAAQDAKRSAEASANKIDGDLKLTRRERSELEHRDAKGFDLMREVFDDQEGWRTRFFADSPGFVSSLHEQVLEWRERTAAVKHAEIKLTQLAQLGEGALSRCKALSERKAKAQGLLDAADKGLCRVREERKSFLEGQSVDSQLRAFADELKRLREALEKTRGAHDKAVRADGETAAREETLRSAAQSARRSHETAQTALDDGLLRLGFHAERLAELLAHDDEWVALELRSIREVESREQAAEVRHRERREKLADHEGSRPELILSDPRMQAPEEEEAAEAVAEVDLPSLREALDAEKKGLDKLGDELRLHFDRDDAARGAHKDSLAEVKKQKWSAAVWINLQALIGSADGQKFRTFAQSLTFDHLLWHANRFLRDLAPRYRLMRVPGQDLELQAIDLDMGEEVRSIHSLSGGESFLISLALALGLASMSARRTKVETLFIDEGFGTLDPQSLDIALSALDSLQAQGHQVGIISHVPGLAERIGVQVRVEKQSGGRSHLCIQG